MDTISTFMKICEISPHAEGHFCEELYVIKNNYGELAYPSVMKSKTEFYMCFWIYLSCGEVNIIFFFLLTNIKVELTSGAAGGCVGCCTMQLQVKGSPSKLSHLWNRRALCRVDRLVFASTALLKWYWVDFCDVYGLDAAAGRAAEMCLWQRSFLWLPACNRT